MAVSDSPVAVVDHEVFDRHRSQRNHPERPERLDAARSGLDRAVPKNARVLVEAREADRAELTRVHPDEYLELLDRRLGTGGFGQLDPDTYFSPKTREAAWRAAGGGISLVEALRSGRADRGVALLRPPGHHAEPDKTMGFCLINHVAVAARAAQAAGQKVAIVDWDVHHGNGTQAAFEEDGDVLFVSMHEWPLYPGTGRPTETGTGAGAGTTVNVAMPASSGDADYAHAMREVVLPAVRAHAPDLLLVSAGYDAHSRDGIARQELSSAMYGAMASSLVEAVGDAKVAFFLEGGYDLQALDESVSATLKAARGQAVALPEDGARAAVVQAVDETVKAHRAHGRWVADA